MKAVLENEMESTIPLDRGFNKNIKWMTFADAEVESRARLFVFNNTLDFDNNDQYRIDIYMN